MKILVLCRDLPLPLTSGEKIRCYHILKGLSQHHDVTLISLIHQNDDLKYVEELGRFCTNVYPIRIRFLKSFSAFKSFFSSQPWDTEAFYTKQVMLKIKTLITSDRYDLIWVNFLSMATYLDEKIASKAICVLDQHNVDELVWANYSKTSDNLAMKIFSKINVRKLDVLQNKILKYFDAIICVSKEDAEYMRKKIPNGTNVYIIPNGVDIEYFRPEKRNCKKSNRILLCASMDVTMNIDAALYFANKIFPLVRAEIDDCEFWVVGRNPNRQLRNLVKKGHINVTGTVDDIRPYYAKAKVFVAPYRFGGGTKLKILEAVAMGLPIVSSPIGCQGINVAQLPQIVVRDDVQGFAQAVIAALESNKSDLYEEYSEVTSKFTEIYSWNNISMLVESMLENSHFAQNKFLCK